MEHLNLLAKRLGFWITLILAISAKANENYILVDSYARVAVTWSSNAFPLLDETASIHSQGENNCQDAAVTFGKKESKKGYSFHQRLDSLVLLRIDQLVNGGIFISKFYYSCNGVYLRID